MRIQTAILLTASIFVSNAHSQGASAEKTRVALSYIDCDGDILIRNGRIGVMIAGRFVADTILGATYVGDVYVWGGDDKRYKLIFADNLSKVTLMATNGHGSVEAKCRRVQD